MKIIVIILIFIVLCLFINKKSKPKVEPVILNTNFGDFILNNPEKDIAYNGIVNFENDELYVNLYFDENSITAEKSLQHFYKFMSDIYEWDKKIKEYSANDYSDKDGLIETWEEIENSDGETVFREITKEEFINRISIGFICFYSNGSMDICYDLDNMYTDHSLMVEANISGEIDCTKLWG